MQFDYPQSHRQDAGEQRIALHCYYHSRFAFILPGINQKKIKTKRLWLFHKSNIITTVLF
ncbi:hypothetical protein EID71_07760 [Salmonella enterica subsp. indica serovar 11:b:e,n,x]|nr:hypothetical protein [Salmonella enterica subsp. indica serovar 11:b:e,n,x]